MGEGVGKIGKATKVSKRGLAISGAGEVNKEHTIFCLQRKEEHTIFCLQRSVHS